MNESLQIRNYQAEDIATLVDIGNAREIAMAEPPALTEERLLRRFGQFIIEFKPERDAFLAISGEKSLGYVVAILDKDHSTGYVDTTIDPNAIGPKLPLAEVLSPLYAKAEAHIRQTLEGDQLPPERPFFLDTFALNQPIDEEKIAIIQELGYSEVRRFYEMLIQFEEDFSPATLPDGLELRPFHRESEAREFHKAYIESFEDHWGNISIYDFDQFAKHFDNPDFDERLWFGAWDGEEIAGVLFGEPNLSHPQRGVVDLLGVRRPWRKRGLGMALLRHSFYVFQQHGFTEAELGVDAESRTNAVSLYQQAGMHTFLEEIVLRKMIWGRPEDIVE